MRFFESYRTSARRKRRFNPMTSFAILVWRMKWVLTLFGASLLSNSTCALSLFPELASVPVAVTTNREAARGVSFDGTNFLVVFQGDNLYPGTNLTNQLAAQFVSADGALLGNRIDLRSNGSVPLVAFGGTNFLIVWADSAHGVPGVYGQMLSRDGMASGDTFLVASNAGVTEVGSIVFAHGQFVIAWAVTNPETHEARILVQRVSVSGEVIESPQPVGESVSPNQRFPHVSAGATNLLLAWVAQRTGTNAWDVLGRYIDPAGHASTAFLISQTPAAAPYPVAAASDGTNYLVVWSRETSPGRHFLLDSYYDSVAGRLVNVLTNILPPALFGRVLTDSNTSEFSVSSARTGQMSPTVVFDGTNYLVAWNDQRNSAFYQIGIRAGTNWWDPAGVTNYTLYLRYLDRFGGAVEKEFVGYDFDWHSHDYTHGTRIGPVLSLGNANAALLRCMSSGADSQAVDVRVILLKARDSTPPRLRIVSGTNGVLRVQIAGPGRVFYTLLESASVDEWPAPRNPYAAGIWYYSTNDIVALPLESAQRFVKAVNGLETCRSNIRSIMRMKEEWALHTDAADWEFPSWDLAVQLLGGAPICPNHGLYVINSLGTFPVCNIPRHVPP